MVVASLLYLLGYRLLFHFNDPHSFQVKLYSEKHQELEQQQLHLNVGLQKIHEMVEQVEELQASLSIMKIELEQKNILANQKHKQMVHDQHEAENKRVMSQKIQEALRVSASIGKRFGFTV